MHYWPFKKTFADIWAKPTGSQKAGGLHIGQGGEVERAEGLRKLLNMLLTCDIGHKTGNYWENLGQNAANRGTAQLPGGQTKARASSQTSRNEVPEEKLQLSKDGIRKAQRHSASSRVNFLQVQYFFKTFFNIQRKYFKFIHRNDTQELCLFFGLENHEMFHSNSQYLCDKH